MHTDIFLGVCFLSSKTTPLKRTSKLCYCSIESRAYKAEVNHMPFFSYSLYCKNTDSTKKIQCQVITICYVASFCNPFLLKNIISIRIKFKENIFLIFKEKYIQNSQHKECG